MKSMEPPDVEVAKRKNIIGMAIDFTAMMRIFARGSNEKIAATTIKGLDDEAYTALQSQLCAESLARELHPVQYGDILWRKHNRRSSGAAESRSSI